MSADPKSSPVPRKRTRKKSAPRTAEPTPKRKKPQTNAKQVEELKNQCQELEDKFLRLRAEFENYRRRKSHEILKLMEYEGEEIFRSFLPIIDDLERMVPALADNASNTDKATREGISLIIAKFHKVLTERGVKAFNSIGEVLDSELHDAMLVMNDQNMPDHEILQEHEKGYLYKDRVLRHAKVVVNKK
ncbi:MAG: nucleotide exchange factor GrpE [Candidatus Marinimicrobia bacterium]|nr:nucleotide exchange factor GrpE [Candidatus Neomarinimicrobiota bacterium]